VSAAGQAVFVFGASMCVLLALVVLCYEFAGKMDSRGVRAAKFCALLWMLAALAGLAIGAT
jgi:uncharacterized membrane protein YozB (DUF420 family)